jgi:excisionase family DNA binding protein
MAVKTTKTEAAATSFDQGKKWFTVYESANYLNRSHQFVRNLIHGGELRAVDLGGILIERADLDKLLFSRKKTFAPYRVGTRPAVASRLAREREAKAKDLV